jgi:energy-coupling factor transporter ATP-binding protein EcfA2
LAVVSADPSGAVELLEFSVDRYKSLEALTVPWPSKLVVLGKNGSGKTSLFEAFTLACGSRASLWQIAQRAITPVPGSIGMVLRGKPIHLPDVSGTEAEDLWWADLGVDRALPWGESLAASTLPPRVADFLAELGKAPILHYRLEQFAGLSDAGECDRGRWYRDQLDGRVGQFDEEDDSGRRNPRGVTFERQYSACLALPSPVPEWLCELAPGLPDAFGPLRTWVDARSASEDRYVDFLELPPVDRVPVAATWLAAERSTDEACFDLQDAFELAIPTAETLTAALDRLPWHPTDIERAAPDSRWWLTVGAIAAASRVLDRLSLDVALDLNDANPDNCTLVSRSGEQSISARGALEGLSAGERVWVDAALAWAAAELEQVSMLNDARHAGLSLLPESDLLDRVMPLSGTLEVETQGWLSADDIDAALSVLDRYFLSIEEHPVNDRFSRDATRQAYLRTTSAFRALVDAPLRIWLIDEPERHLQASAQRSVYKMLDDQSGTGDVALATHSQYFLRQEGWNHLHLARSPEGTVATLLDLDDLTIERQVVHELGWGHGELLAWDRFILFVEGKTDQEVLERLYGDALSAAGVRVLPIGGVDEAASLAELRLIQVVLDIPAGVMFDHVRLPKLASTRGASSGLRKEERALRELNAALKKRGRKLEMFGLAYADILCYLPEDQIRLELPNFPGWKPIMSAWERDKGADLKSLITTCSKGRLGPREISNVLDRMIQTGVSTTGDLAAVVQSIVQSANNER